MHVANRYTTLFATVDLLQSFALSSMPVQTVSYAQQSVTHMTDMIDSVSVSLPCALYDLLHWEAQLERERQQQMAIVQRQSSAPLPLTSALTSDVTAAADSGRSHTAPPSQDRSATSAAFVMIWSHFQHLFTSRLHPFGHALALFVSDTNRRIMQKIDGHNSSTGKTTTDSIESSLNRTTSSSETSLPLSSLSFSSSSSSSSSSTSSSSSCEEYMTYLLYSIRSFLTSHYTNIITSYPHLQETIICRKIAYYTLKSIVYDSLSVTLFQLYQYIYMKQDELVMLRLNTLKQHFFIKTSSSYTPTNSDRNSSNSSNSNNSNMSYNRSISNDSSSSSSSTILLADSSSACIVEALRHVFDSKSISDKFSRLVIVCKDIATMTINSSADVTATIMSSSIHQDEVINKFIHYLIPLTTISTDTTTDHHHHHHHHHHQQQHHSHYRLYSTTRLMYDLMDEFITNDEQRFYLNLFMQTINTLSM